MVDNYTDTIPLEKALKPTTLLAYEMNGASCGIGTDTAGLIVPGYFEKTCEMAHPNRSDRRERKKIYEAQGWGPDFITPTRSRIDVPDPVVVFVRQIERAD
jgi:hypothetical protein